MTELRFGTSNASPLQESFLTRQAYNVGTKVFNMPAALGRRTDRFVSNHASGNIVERAAAMSVKNVGGFLKKYVLDFDFRETTQIKLGKFQFTAPRPPIGAMLIFLYVGAIVPRSIRAHQRGKENGGDYREVFDVLRRDFTAITLFAFMLDPLLKVLNKTKQRFNGLELVDRKDNELLSYGALENYKLVNKQVLLRLLEEGNGEGLVKAIHALDKTLAGTSASPQLKHHLDALKQIIPDLVEAHQADNQKVRAQLAGDALQHIKTADALIAEALEKVQVGGTKSAVKQLTKLQGSFENMVTRYAQTRRLPIDILGFALVVGAIGWFPVWFNGLWNKKRFVEEQQVMPQMNATPMDTKGMFQSLQASSPYSTTFASQPQNPLMRNS